MGKDQKISLTRQTMRVGTGQFQIIAGMLMWRIICSRHQTQEKVAANDIMVEKIISGLVEENGQYFRKTRHLLRDTIR